MIIFDTPFKESQVLATIRYTKDLLNDVLSLWYSFGTFDENVYSLFEVLSYHFKVHQLESYFFEK